MPRVPIQNMMCLLIKPPTNLDDSMFAWFFTSQFSTQYSLHKQILDVRRFVLVNTKLYFNAQ